MIKLLQDIHNEKITETYKLEINKPLNELYEKDLPEFSDKKVNSKANKEIFKNEVVNKKYSRTRMQSFTNQLTSVTVVKNNHFIGHFTSSDLSVLKDFESLKEDLDIVNNSYVTISKPLLIDNTNVIIRDTMLLAPGSKKGLSNIGSLYDSKLNKKDIGEYIKNMKKFLEIDYDSFKKYAIQDALITLIHASYMEQFNFENGTIGIPLSLSSLSNSFVKNY
jgi:hypothetical protein